MIYADNQARKRREQFLLCLRSGSLFSSCKHLLLHVFNRPKLLFLGEVEQAACAKKLGLSVGRFSSNVWLIMDRSIICVIN
jgi:hypothetical protein